MKIKKFEAASMKEALEKIKEDMGADAFILSTRQINKKGPLGFGDRKFLQVTAAIEEDESAEKPESIDIRQDKEEAWAAALGEAPATTGTYNAAGRPQKPIEPMPEPADESTPFTAGFEAVFAEARKAAKESNISGHDSGKDGGKRLRQELSEIKELVRDLGSHPTDFSPLQKELADLKNLLFNVIRSQTPFGGKSLSQVLFAYYQKLKDSGMDDAMATKLIQIVDEKLEKEEDKRDTKKVMRLLLAMIKKSIDVSHDLGLGGGEPVTLALIGPTGVGKTTTIAKLAAWAALQKQADVVLITLDSYRIGATEQLKNYAKIMEIPIQVALNVNELRQAIQFHHDKDLILIDTAGQSQRDSERLDLLKDLLGGQSDIQKHLVLSATTKTNDLNDIVQRFGVLNPTHLLFTKLDETSSYGPLFTQIVKTRKPVSFITTGQSVPEDFDFASKDLLAGLLLGKSLTDLAKDSKGGGK